MRGCDWCVVCYHALIVRCKYLWNIGNEPVLPDNTYGAVAHRSCMDEKFPVKSVRTSLGLVERIIALKGATSSQLAEEFGIAQSTVHDHLKTLENSGFLINDAGTYTTSTKFLELGEKSRSNRLIYEVAKPEVRKLANQTDEHAGLMIREHEQGVFLYTTMSDFADPLSLEEYAGIRMPLYVSAPSKSILAHMPEERIDSILLNRESTAGDNEAAQSTEAIRSDLEKIRERGYAVSRGERIGGMLAIAAPILDPSGHPQGALSVYGPISHIENQELIEEFSELVKRAVNVVEVNMNYS